MITKNLMEYMKRQNALAAKVADGSATDDDRAELRKLTDVLRAATGDHEPQCKTELVALSADEAKKYVETEAAEAEAAMDPDRLALLKRNLAEIKRQKEAGADVFAIQRAVAKADDGVAELSARVDKLESKLDELFAKLSEKDESSDEETAEEEQSEEAAEADDAEADDAEADDAEEDKAEDKADAAEADAAEEEKAEEEDKEAVSWGDLSEEAVADTPHGASDTYQALKTACGRRKA
jgi:uncharacterized coiled-coil protein SlyX